MILFPLMMYGAKLMYGAVMLISETSVQAYVVFHLKNIYMTYINLY